MAEAADAVFSETARLLGIGAEVPPLLAEQIRGLRRTLNAAAEPRRVWGIFDIRAGADSVTFDGAFSIKGKKLAGLLRGSPKAALMAVTLGASVDRLINRLQATAMDEAVIADACASAETEALCDRVEGEIMEAIGGGVFLTMRYSPGYGDTPPEESEKIIAALNASRVIGLTTTKSGMLCPIKSITAVTGLSGVRRDRGRSCRQCGLSGTCLFKKRGDTCGV